MAGTHEHGPEHEAPRERPREPARSPAIAETLHPDPSSPAPAATAPPPAPSHSVAAVAPPHSRKWLWLAGLGIVLLSAGYFLYPTILTMLNTVSTDDAYVNSHVTLLAPRVAGKVLEVYVDDNQRVKKGDILVVLDKKPYEVDVAIKKAAVGVAEADLVQARAQVSAQFGLMRASRFKLDHAIEDVKNQIANLGAAVATLNSKKASLDLARANLKRGEELVKSGGISKEDLDLRRQTVKVDEAIVEQSLQQVYAIRAGLGLVVQPPKEQDLAAVPEDLPQNFSSVRQALGDLLQAAAQVGYKPSSWSSSPKEVIAEFYKQDPKGNLDKILADLLPHAPSIKLAEAKLLQARQDLDLAELNLSYCEVYSEIDGQVTRRTVHPGNYVQVGQNLMAIRPLKDIWIDANFKETQLDYLRIGQPVRIEVDMYGNHHEFKGHISGFTMGTGQTLALLPPQNATGNFVKIVQRLPVRIDLDDYDPDKLPLFVGLSCTPYVYYNEPAKGPDAGKFLQPFAPLQQIPPTTRPEPQGRGTRP